MRDFLLLSLWETQMRHFTAHTLLFHSSETTISLRRHKNRCKWANCWYLVSELTLRFTFHCRFSQKTPKNYKVDLFNISVGSTRNQTEIKLRVFLLFQRNVSPLEISDNFANYLEKTIKIWSDLIQHSPFQISTDTTGYMYSPSFHTGKKKAGSSSPEWYSRGNTKLKL